jgi:ubiquinone/menaquinone biosynthesis C-methylase UbiE
MATKRSIAGTVRIHRCPICSSKQVNPLWAIPLSRIQPAVVVTGANTELWPILDLKSHVYCYDGCEACGSIYRNPADGGSKEGYRTTTRYDGLLDDTTRLRGHRAQYDAWIRPYIPHEEDLSIIDACCGAGEYLTFALSEHPKAKLVGIELAERPMAELHRRYSGRITTHVQDVDEPQALVKHVDAGSFDFAIWSESFEHVADPPMALQNITAVLKRGTGRLFMTAQSTEGKLPIRPEEPIYTSAEALKQLFTRAGLQVDKLVLEAGRWKAIVTRS